MFPEASPVTPLLAPSRWNGLDLMMLFVIRPVKVLFKQHRMFALMATRKMCYIGDSGAAAASRISLALE